MSAEAARRTVRFLTWGAFAAGVIGIALVAFPEFALGAGPWLQLALGILTLVLAFGARKVGMAEVEGFDGRISLFAALLGFAIVFFAGQVAWALLVAVAN